MCIKIPQKKINLFLFSFFLAILTYGFALTNFTINVDNEMPILPDFGMDLGRWGQNLILYHIFGGHIQYFSLFLSLFLFSVAAVQICKLFKFNGLPAYCFCGLFITFPQISYQVVFGMMSVVAAIGVLLSVYCVKLFVKGYKINILSKKLAFYLAMAFILMFTLSIYQAFILVPITLYLVLFFQNTYEDTFKIVYEIKKALNFGVVVLVSVILYYFSVKIICPEQQAGYIGSFVSGGFDNFFSNFITISGTNLAGNSFYGEKLYIIVTILVVILSVKMFLIKEHFIYRFLALIFLIISPFLFLYFVTNGYYPPRLCLTSNIVFAFVIVFSIKSFKINSFKVISISMSLIFLMNIYFVTMLFICVNKIYKHDKRIAEKIDNIIQTKYPSFNSTEKFIYFYGYFPYEYHQKFRLKRSEIFGGSFYSWDNGNNYRIINFFREADVAEYTMITKEKFDVVQDSIKKMPVWPDYESIRMIDNAIIVKLGSEKGGLLYFE